MRTVGRSILALTLLTTALVLLFWSWDDRSRPTAIPVVVPVSMY